MAHDGQGQQRKRRGAAVRHLHMHSQAFLLVYWRRQCLLYAPSLRNADRNAIKAAAQVYRNPSHQTAR